MWDLIYIFDLLGTAAFAISGALAAIDKKYDVFGVIFVAFITALGGGTTRDMMLGITPVSWMQDLTYFYVVMTAVAITFLLSSKIMKWRKTLFLFDSIGLGVFTIAGMQKAIEVGLNWELAIMMGVISATLGGIFRDVFNGEKPLILQKEIYATACFAGGLLLALLSWLGAEPLISVPVTILTIILIRILAVRYRWALPVLKNKNP
jgi:uncharacterized membrane protein YeiH